MRWKKKRTGEDPNYGEKRNSRKNRDDDVRVVKRERKRGRYKTGKFKDENIQKKEEILKNADRESEGGSVRKEGSAAEVN